MATDIDIFAIKERIVDILDSDTDLYDATGADGKVRKIEAGAPDLNKIDRETVLPHIFVTNDTVIEDVKLTGSAVSNALKSQQHTLQFKIILVVDGKDGPKAEETADDFAKLIKETMSENFDLRNPSTGLDPKVLGCNLLQHGILNTNLFGSSKQGRFLRYRALVNTG